MKKGFLFTLLIFSFLFVHSNAYSDNENTSGVKNEFKEAGRSMKKGFKKTGRGIKKGAKKTGRAFKKGGKSFKDEIKK